MMQLVMQNETREETEGQRLFFANGTLEDIQQGRFRKVASVCWGTESLLRKFLQSSKKYT